MWPPSRVFAPAAAHRPGQFQIIDVGRPNDAVCATLAAPPTDRSEQSRSGGDKRAARPADPQGQEAGRGRTSCDRPDGSASPPGRPWPGGARVDNTIAPCALRAMASWWSGAVGKASADLLFGGVSGQSGSALPGWQSSDDVFPPRAWATVTEDINATNARPTVSLRMGFGFHSACRHGVGFRL